MGDDAVRKIYTDHPFPERDPQDERKRLFETIFGYMRLVNSMFWGGRKRFGPGFRVLDAGCGTGDAVIHIAEELRGTGAEIVALDFSEASITVARKRAEIRGLNNITFIVDSLLNIPRLGLGKFDYIVCAGVLPHLDSPKEGLAVLEGCLKEDGGMGLVLYGKYGRLPVIVMKDIAGLVSSCESEPSRRAAMIDGIRERLPAFNWLRMMGSYQDLGYDAMLTSHMREYSVPDIHSLLKAAGSPLNEQQDNTAFVLRGQGGQWSPPPGSVRPKRRPLLQGEAARGG